MGTGDVSTRRSVPPRTRFRPGPQRRKPRAPLMRNLGELITKHVPGDRADRNRRHRPGDRTDEEAAHSARGRQLPLLRRGVHADGRHTYPSIARCSTTRCISRGRVRAHLAGNVPFMTATWKTAPASRSATPRCSDVGISRSPRAPGRTCAGSRHPPGVLNVVQGYGRTAAKRCASIRCAGDLVHRSTATGNRIVQTRALKNSPWSWAASRRS